MLRDVAGIVRDGAHQLTESVSSAVVKAWKSFLSKWSGTKKSAQRESFQEGYPAEIWDSSGACPGSKKTFGRPSKTLENKHLGVDVHDPNARTSMTPVAKNLRAQKLWADFLVPKN